MWRPLHWLTAVVSMQGQVTAGKINAHHTVAALANVTQHLLSSAAPSPGPEIHLIQKTQQISLSSMANTADSQDGNGTGAQKQQHASAFVKAEIMHA